MSKTKQKFGFIDMPLEIIFAVLGLIFGLFFVFINPPFQTNDSDRHFFHAYHIS
ncbi:MAG: hypothetical protein QG635_518, partial [Bacteroidota bacterium]|nr:hypothetical protein [Bacteroidota bacterium]